MDGADAVPGILKMFVEHVETRFHEKSVDKGRVINIGCFSDDVVRHSIGDD